MYDCDTEFYFTGMNKMVVNHLEKLFVTNDAATIIKELEVWKMNSVYIRKKIMKKNNVFLHQPSFTQHLFLFLKQN